MAVDFSRKQMRFKREEPSAAMQKEPLSKACELQGAFAARCYICAATSLPILIKSAASDHCCSCCKPPTLPPPALLPRCHLPPWNLLGRMRKLMMTEENRGVWEGGGLWFCESIVTQTSPREVSDEYWVSVRIPIGALECF